MRYRLAMHPLAQAEWSSLDPSIKSRVKKKLEQRLEHPSIEGARLRGAPNCFKIKLANPQFRLVYHVSLLRNTVTILAVGSRDDIYDRFVERLAK